jgi:uncharacterized protein YjbI with pentapeptide repeats
LSGASIRFARFVRCDLQGADFARADMQNTLFEGARNIPQGVLDNVAAFFGAEGRR